jgi:hypothetical protein
MRVQTTKNEPFHVVQARELASRSDHKNICEKHASGDSEGCKRNRDAPTRLHCLQAKPIESVTAKFVCRPRLASAHTARGSAVRYRRNKNSHRANLNRDAESTALWAFSLPSGKVATPQSHSPLEFKETKNEYVLSAFKEPLGCPKCGTPMEPKLPAEQTCASRTWESLWWSLIVKSVTTLKVEGRHVSNLKSF